MQWCGQVRGGADGRRRAGAAGAARAAVHQHEHRYATRGSGGWAGWCWGRDKVAGRAPQELMRACRCVSKPHQAIQRVLGARRANLGRRTGGACLRAFLHEIASRILTGGQRGSWQSCQRRRQPSGKRRTATAAKRGGLRGRSRDERDHRGVHERSIAVCLRNEGG